MKWKEYRSLFLFCLVLLQFVVAVGIATVEISSVDVAAVDGRIKISKCCHHDDFCHYLLLTLVSFLQ
jgi:hypothetical protein